MKPFNYLPTFPGKGIGVAVLTLRYLPMLGSHVYYILRPFAFGFELEKFNIEKQHSHSSGGEVRHGRDTLKVGGVRLYSTIQYSC